MLTSVGRSSTWMLSLLNARDVYRLPAAGDRAPDPGAASGCRRGTASHPVSALPKLPAVCWLMVTPSVLPSLCSNRPVLVVAGLQQGPGWRAAGEGRMGGHGGGDGDCCCCLDQSKTGHPPSSNLSMTESRSTSCVESAIVRYRLDVVVVSLPRIRSLGSVEDCAWQNTRTERDEAARQFVCPSAHTYAMGAVSACPFPPIPVVDLAPRTLLPPTPPNPAKAAAQLAGWLTGGRAGGQLEH